MYRNIVIFGASGAIGRAFALKLANQYTDASITVFSRSNPDINSDNVRYQAIDYCNEEMLANAAEMVSNEMPIDLVIVATGILHDETTTPEKSLKALSAEKLQHVYMINAVIPALIAKYFLPKLNTDDKSFFAALSARVGSISDNQLGGWYAYRASKAALNMLIKTASIETKRQNKKAIIVGLHPGTVDSDLSKPFQSNVPKDKLFSPDFAAEKLLQVLDNLSTTDTGNCFAWDGERIEP